MTKCAHHYTCTEAKHRFERRFFHGKTHKSRVTFQFGPRGPSERKVLAMGRRWRRRSHLFSVYLNSAGKDGIRIKIRVPSGDLLQKHEEACVVVDSLDFALVLWRGISAEFIPLFEWCCRSRPLAVVWCCFFSSFGVVVLVSPPSRCPLVGGAAVLLLILLWAVLFSPHPLSRRCGFPFHVEWRCFPSASSFWVLVRASSLHMILVSIVMIHIWRHT